ncbi:MAG: AsmA-like C-terminal domain-containing protein [Phycisphaerae bacterium]|nr:AsmA-like C-terminal domain-containing protein [Phycisphaerae bacterium]
MESHKQHNRTGWRGDRVIRRCAISVLVPLTVIVLYALLVNQLPNLAIEQIGKLTHTDLGAKSVTLRLNGAVEIRDLIILPKDQALRKSTILKAETVRVKFSRLSLLLLKPKLKHILIRNFLLDAQFNKDVDLWNIEGMAIDTLKAEKSSIMPAIVLENGVLRYSTIEKKFINVLASVPIDATFELNEITEQGHHFQIKTANIFQNVGQSILNGFWIPGRVTVTGGLSSRDTPSMERVWSIGAMAAQLEYDAEKNYTFQSSIRNFRSRLTNLKPAWREIPEWPNPATPLKAVENFFARYQPSGEADLEVNASGNLNHLAESEYEARLNCLNVSMQDRAFDYPIDHLAGLVTFRKNAILSQGLQGRHNAAPVHIEFDVDTSFSPPHYIIKAKSDHLALDLDLFNALNDQQKELWKRFNPRGLTAFEYERQRLSPNDIQKKLMLNLRDAEVTYLGFPYRLEHLTGRVMFEADRTDFSDLISQVANRQITINGFMLKQSDYNDFHLDIQARNIPLDDTLSLALPEITKTGYDQLNMSGQTDAMILIRPDPNQPGQVTIHTDLTLQNATLHVLEKKLPLTRANGRVTLSSRGIEIKSLDGLFYGDPFSVTGNIELDEQSKPTLYDLVVASKGLAINSVTEALPERPVQIIKKFQPTGKIGLRAHLRRIRHTEELLCNAVVNCNGLIIEPKPYPYALQAFQGELVIDNDLLQFNDVWALPVSQAAQRKPNETIGLRINGEALMTDGRFTSGQFEFSGIDLMLEKTLGLAMPEQMAASYEALSPSGTLNIDPSRIKITSGQDNVYYVDYQTQATVTDCNLTLIGADAELVKGSFVAAGHYDTQSGLQTGMISLSPCEVRVKGKKATNLTANINYDPNDKQWLSQDVLADFYGGRIAGQLCLALKSSERPEHCVQLTVTDANLQEFLMDSPKESARTQKQSVGDINGYLSVITPLLPGEQRIGRCMFKVINMQVGKVSPLSKLLLALSLTEPKDYAFDTMIVNSYIQGETLHIEQLDLEGKSVAFNGSGTIYLPTEALNLSLIARGKRLASSNPTPLESLTEGLFGTVMRVIVKGTLNDPEIKTHMPMLEDPFKLLGSPTE